MHRRKFLFTGLIAGLSGFALCSSSAMAKTTKVKKNQEPKDFTYKMIANWYLDMYPQENNKKTLIKVLSEKNITNSELVLKEYNDFFTTHVKAACQKDYDNGDVVFIGGWLLARTEAQICSLKAFG